MRIITKLEFQERQSVFMTIQETRVRGGKRGTRPGVQRSGFERTVDGAPT